MSPLARWLSVYLIIVYYCSPVFARNIREYPVSPDELPGGKSDAPISLTPSLIYIYNASVRALDFALSYANGPSANFRIPPSEARAYGDNVPPLDFANECFSTVFQPGALYTIYWDDQARCFRLE